MQPSAIRDKVIAITGAAGRLGAELTNRLAKKGAVVLATDIRPDGLDEKSRLHDWPNHRVHSRVLDVRDPDGWRRLVDWADQHHGGIDILINNAAVATPGHLDRLELSDIDRHVEVNLVGTMYGSYIVSSSMQARGGGHIVNIGSIASVAPTPGVALYGATKSGIRAFSLALHHELKPDGIAVSVVLANAFRSELLASAVDDEQAAIIFSGPIIEARDIVDQVVGRVLPDRPAEIAVPIRQGCLGKLAGAFPRLFSLLLSSMLDTGKKHQRAERRRRSLVSGERESRD